MLTLITGLQRSGKSYLAVEIAKREYLSGRKVYTNLPLTDSFFALAPHFAGNVTLYIPDTSFRYLRRISRRLKTFFKKTRLEKFELDFYERMSNSSVLILDECYEIFKMSDYKSAGGSRQKLLSYLKQHGHYHDDIYLISHDPRDIDRIVRTSVMVEYRVQNLKFQGLNIFDSFSIRTPFNCVRVEKYVSGKYDSTDFRLRLSKDIFGLYESFSESDNIGRASAAGCPAPSVDRSNKGFRFILYFTLSLFLLIGLGSCLYFKRPRVSGVKSDSVVSAVSHDKPIAVTPLPLDGYTLSPGGYTLDRESVSKYESTPFICRIMLVEKTDSKALKFGIDFDASLSGAFSWENLLASQGNPVYALALSVTGNTYIDANSDIYSVIDSYIISGSTGIPFTIKNGRVIYLETYSVSNEGTRVVSGYEARDVGDSIECTVTEQYCYLSLKRSQNAISNEEVRTEFTGASKYIEGVPVVFSDVVSRRSIESYEQGIPFLSDIPWIGYLFRITKNEDVSKKMTLIVTITKVLQ